MNETKDTNPKDAVGIAKVPMSTVSGPVMMEIGLAMMEGALKYGRHNYRVAGIRFSVYYDALMRHMMAWWEGEDIDPASGVSHVTKALATLVVLRDAMIQQKATDDRPPKSPAGFIDRHNEIAKALLARYPNPVPAYIEQKDPAGSDLIKNGRCNVCGRIAGSGECLATHGPSEISDLLKAFKKLDAMTQNGDVVPDSNIPGAEGSRD